MKIKIQNFSVKIHKMEIYYAFNGFLEGNIRYALDSSYKRFIDRHTPKYNDGKPIDWCIPKQIKAENILNLTYDQSEAGPCYIYVLMDCNTHTSSGEKHDSSTLSCIMNMQNFSMKKVHFLLKNEIDWDKEAHNLEPG